MENLPKRIKREIFRANKKANKLRRKYGFKNAKSKCTKDTLFEIEIKVPYEDFIAGKIPNIEEAKEYAYFYNRDDMYFGVEKIKDGKLKEYYEQTMPYIKMFSKNFNEIIDTFKCLNIANINNQNELIKFLNEKEILKDNYIFKINNSIFYLNYSSFDIDINDVDEIYFYQYEFTKNRIFLRNMNDCIFKNGREIIRYSKELNRIDRIYFETRTNDDKIIFYYYDVIDNKLKNCSEVLIRI